MGLSKMTLQELQRNAQEKLSDAKSLLSSNRYSACYYICGYALELMIKYRVAKQLNWQAIDVNDHPFLKSHDLDKLVKYTGVFDGLLRMREWDTCRKWNPEMRYLDSAATTAADASEMLTSTEALVLWLTAN